MQDTPLFYTSVPAGTRTTQVSGAFTRDQEIYKLVFSFRQNCQDELAVSVWETDSETVADDADPGGRPLLSSRGAVQEVRGDNETITLLLNEKVHQRKRLAVSGLNEDLSDPHTLKVFAYLRGA